MRLESNYRVQKTILPIYEETAETVSINPPYPPNLGAPLSQRSHKYNWIYVSHIVRAVKYFSNFNGLLRNGWLGFSNYEPILAAVAGHPHGTAGDIDSSIGFTEREIDWIISGFDMAGYINRIKTGRLIYCTIHSLESARIRLWNRALLY